MQEDERCCGTGTCIIDADGRCWCGQQWNGRAMCWPERPATPPAASEPAHEDETPVPVAAPRGAPGRK